MQQRRRRRRSASVPVDRGWAWVVALASCGIFGLAGGSLKSAGIVYVEASERYDNVGVEALWIFTIAQAATFCTGPFAGFYIRRTSHRTVIIVGAAIMSSAVIVSGFLPSISMMYLTWTLQGVGAGCLYIGGLTCTAAYFDRHKGLAVGLTGAGSGVGAFLLPGALRLLFDHYSYGGALLLYGAILAHAAMLALLVRPLSSYTVEPALIAAIEPASVGERNWKSLDGVGLEANYGIPCETASGAVLVPSSAAAATPAPGALPQRPPEGVFVQALGLCRRPHLWLVSLTSLFVVCGMSVVYASIPPLGRQTGIDKATVALLIAMGGAGETVSRPLHGWLSDRGYISSIGHVSVCAGATALGNLACALLGGNVVGLGVLSATLGLFGTAIMSLSPVVVRDLLGAGNVELGMGAQMAFQAAGVLASTAATAQNWLRLLSHKASGQEK